MFDNTSDSAKPVSSATQTALNAKLNVNNAICTGYTYFKNITSSDPFDRFGGFYGCITCNMTVLSGGGNAEMDFVNCGKYYTNMNIAAFNWYLKTSETTHNLLMSLRNTGSLEILGTITSPTRTDLQSQNTSLANILLNDNIWTGTNTFNNNVKISNLSINGYNITNNFKGKTHSTITPISNDIIAT